jgi:PIN domain nuclease of toxin-antitoxin system
MADIERAAQAGDLAFSAISVWETAVLVRRGRYALGTDVGSWRADLMRAGLLELPFGGDVALKAVGLDLPDQDPADRFIVATALHASARLLTSDRVILTWAAGSAIALSQAFEVRNARS